MEAVEQIIETPAKKKKTSGRTHYAFTTDTAKATLAKITEIIRTRVQVTVMQVATESGLSVVTASVYLNRLRDLQVARTVQSRSRDPVRSRAPVWVLGSRAKNVAPDGDRAIEPTQLVVASWPVGQFRRTGLDAALFGPAGDDSSGITVIDDEPAELATVPAVDQPARPAIKWPDPNDPSIAFKFQTPAVMVARPYGTGVEA